MRIRGDDNDQGPLASIRNAAKDIERTTRNLSSGNRLNSAADDAAALSIAENLATRVRSLQAVQRNVQTGVSLAQTADAGLQNIQEGVQRVRELATRAANGTLDDADRQAIQAEINQITAEIDRTATDTQFNGRALLNGQAGGANAVQITAGANAETVAIDIADTRAAAIGLDTVDVTTQAGAQAAVQAADQALQQVSQTRSQVGANQNALQRIANRVGTQAANEAAAESRIRDADIAQESTLRAAALIRSRFAVAVEAQRNQNRGSILNLLNE